MIVQGPFEPGASSSEADLAFGQGIPWPGPWDGLRGPNQMTALKLIGEAIVGLWRLVVAFVRGKGWNTENR